MAAFLMYLAVPAALCTAGAADAGRPDSDGAVHVVSHAAGPDSDGAVHVLSHVEPVPAPADSLAEVYRSGRTWEAFLTAVNARRELWQSKWTGASVAEDLLARARAVGSWRILAITVPGCSDSANTLPYIARLVERVPGLELRLVDSTIGRPWMEAHRTPDGRAATPTLLILDEQHRIRGCWIEQPAKLQAWWLAVVAERTQSREAARKQAWYDEDAGREAMREFVEVLEAAHAGRVICPGADGAR